MTELLVIAAPIVAAAGLVVLVAWSLIEPLPHRKLSLQYRIEIPTPEPGVVQDLAVEASVKIRPGDPIGVGAGRSTQKVITR